MSEIIPKEPLVAKFTSPSRDYSTFPKEIFASPLLSPVAKTLLGSLLSLDAKQPILRQDLLRLTGLGATAMTTVLKELMALGCCNWVPFKEGGRITGGTYTFTLEPLGVQKVSKPTPIKENLEAGQSNHNPHREDETKPESVKKDPSGTIWLSEKNFHGASPKAWIHYKTRQIINQLALNQECLLKNLPKEFSDDGDVLGGPRTRELLLELVIRSRGQKHPLVFDYNIKDFIEKLEYPRRFDVAFSELGLSIETSQDLCSENLVDWERWKALIGFFGFVLSKYQFILKHNQYRPHFCIQAPHEPGVTRHEISPDSPEARTAFEIFTTFYIYRYKVNPVVPREATVKLAEIFWFEMGGDQALFHTTVSRYLLNNDEYLVSARHHLNVFNKGYHRYLPAPT